MTGWLYWFEKIKEDWYKKLEPIKNYRWNLDEMDEYDCWL